MFIFTNNLNNKLKTILYIVTIVKISYYYNNIYLILN